MNHVDRIIGHAEDHCKAHGARLTVKRKQVLAGLIQSEKALSAYELFINNNLAKVCQLCRSIEF
jgi:Fur family zinc uptake transcriptional regulator